MANAKIKHLQLPNGTTYDFHAVTADSATSATTASKLSTNAGSATNPVYFTGGVPTACTYSLNKTVPNDAVFTDTNTHRPIQVNGTEILGNNTTALNLKAGSNVSVTNSSGTVTIAATDTNNAVTQTATSTNANYEVLFSATADNTTRTEGARKYSNLTFNPSTGTLTTNFFVGGNNGGGWHVGRNNATVKKTTADNTSTFYPIWSVKTYTGDWSAGTLGNGGEALYFVNTLDTNYSSNVNKGRKYRFYGSSNADDNTTYDIVHKTSFTSGQVVVADGTSGLVKTSGYTIAKSVPSDAVFTDTNTTYTLGTSGSSLTLTPSNGTAQTVGITDTVKNALGVDASSEAGTFLDIRGNWSTPGLVYQSVDNSTNSNEPLLFVHSSSEAITSTRKSTKLSFNPSGGGLNVTGYISVTGSTGTITATNNITSSNGEFVAGTGIELGMASANAAAFIDFHWNSINTDYTARIQQRGENTVDLIGKNSSTWGIWRAASFSSQSSIHVKENVQSITAEDAKRLLQLRPVTFNYKNGGLTDQAGLIAEEVNLVMPKMVIGDINFNPEEPWNAPSIDYSKFVPYLIKMVQEQQKEIDELRRLVQG